MVAENLINKDVYSVCSALNGEIAIKKVIEFNEKSEEICLILMDI